MEKRKKSLREGAFIVLEGPEGNGKTTQAELLKKALSELGFKVLRTREPGGTPEGEKIREILLNNTDVTLTSRTEVLLFLAARAAITEKVIVPALSSGQVVITDRFDLSTFAYQVAGRGLSFDEVWQANQFAKGGLVPDLLIYLEVDPKVAEERMRGRGQGADKIESAGKNFHERVYEGYEQYVLSIPIGRRLHVPSAVTHNTPEFVLAHILKFLREFFSFE